MGVYLHDMEPEPHRATSSRPVWSPRSVCRLLVGVVVV
jgi:hypothetical protein